MGSLGGWGPLPLVQDEAQRAGILQAQLAGPNQAVFVTESAMLALYRDLKGSLKGDKDIDVEVEVGVDIDWYFGCLKEVSKSVQALLNGIKAVMMLTFIILKPGALSEGDVSLYAETF